MSADETQPLASSQQQQQEAAAAAEQGMIEFEANPARRPSPPTNGLRNPRGQQRPGSESEARMPEQPSAIAGGAKPAGARRPVRFAADVQVQLEPEPEPQPAAGAPLPRALQKAASASESAWNEALVYTSDELEKTVVMQSQVGWTQMSDMQHIRLPAQQAEQVQQMVGVGETVKWSVGVAVHAITVQVSFVTLDGADAEVQPAQKLGSAEDRQQSGSAFVCGTFTAQSAGSLQLTLGNDAGSEAARVTYSFSLGEFEVTLNRKALLMAKPVMNAAAAVATELDDDDEDDADDEERSLVKMDLCDVTDEMVQRIGDTDLVIELPPCRPDEPPRTEGKQILHLGKKSLQQEWETELRMVLGKARADRVLATTTMQVWSRVGFAKRIVAEKKRNKLFHDHRKRLGSTKSMVGFEKNEYSNWTKPHGQLKLKPKPLFHTFENATLMDVQLVGGVLGQFFEAGVWWQEPPDKIDAKSTEIYGSHAKRTGAGNSGCVMYSCNQVDIVLGFCRPAIGKEWTAGRLYAKGTVPSSLEEVFEDFEKGGESSTSEEDGSTSEDEMETPASSGESPASSRSGSATPKKRKSRRRSVTDFTKSISSGLLDIAGVESTKDTPTGVCILKGLALEWSQAGSETPAQWTLCTEKEHEKKEAENLKLAGAASGDTGAEVVEEIIQVQFFNPLFRKYDGAYWRMVPSQNVPQFQVPAWSDSKGRKLGHWKSVPEQVHAEADRRMLPPEGNWVWDDEPWTVDASGSTEEEGWQYTRGLPHVPGHPCNNLPELPGLGWSASHVFGSLVRRRTWQRVRRKRKKHIRKKSDLVNPFFTTTAQPKFIARITTSNGDVVSIWRPQVPGTKMILGDVVMKGNNPPEKMTVVDPAKVLNSRSEVQREWVKRAAIFKSVWDNGKVYMWRPVVPTVPARFLQRKHLHPLGWIFTTSPAPPDLENVCVIHQEYLQPMTDTDLDSLPSWCAAGFFFEAAKFTDRTLQQKAQPHITLEIQGEELGFTLKGADIDGSRRMVLEGIVPESDAARCEGLEEGMLLTSIMGYKAAALHETDIIRLQQKRPLRLAFEKNAEGLSWLTSAVDRDGDGKVSLLEIGDTAGALLKGGLGMIGKVGSAAGGLVTKTAKHTLNKAQSLTTHIGRSDDDDEKDGVRVHQESQGVDLTTKSRDANEPCEAMLFLERKNKLLYVSLNDEMYCDIRRMESFWMIKKDIQPEEEADTIARSSRYTPHLKTLQLASQAAGDNFVCSAMITELHSSRQGLEMITGSGSSFRAWDLLKGECVRELKFPGTELSCLAAAGNSVFSGSGRVLTGTDISGGKKLPGASFQHTGMVTCANAVELSHKDTSGRPMIAVVSGSDVHDGVVRMWISDEGSAKDNADISTEDRPQTFRRVGMPGIGEHRSGGVTSLCMWPQNSPAPHACGFRYYRLVVNRSARQLKDVRVRHGDRYETHLPTIGFANFKLLCNASREKSTDDDLIPITVDGTETSKTAAVPTSAQNLSYSRPYKIDINSDAKSVDWSLAATDPEADRQNSFIRCAAGVLELYFERPIAADSYSWEAAHVNQQDGAVEVPEQWQLFASCDWISWVCVDDCSEIPLDDIPETGIKRNIDHVVDAAVSQAPSGPPDLRHVPMVVSTGAQAVRVWSVCADFATPDEKKRGAKGVSLSMMRGHEDQVTCCAVTQKGEVISGSKDCTVRLWRPHAGQCLAVLRAGSPILCVTTFDSPSSMHLQDERILLRKGAPLHDTRRYTVRQVLDSELIGGDILLSSGHETLDSTPIPGYGESGEDSFDAYAWRLEAAPEPNCIYIKCERDDQSLYLSHDDGKVALMAAEYRSAWKIEWKKDSKARPANPKNAIGRGQGGEALLKLMPFNRITSTCQVFPTAATNDDEKTDLLPGTVIQIVGEPVRPIRDADSLWQQVVVVGEESDSSLMHSKRVGGWMCVAYQTTHLVDMFMEPLPNSVALGKLRCMSVPAGQPAYLTLRQDPAMMDTTSASMMNTSSAVNSSIMVIGQDEQQIPWQFANKGRLFKFEEAMPETTIVAGCKDGSAKIWSNTAVGGRWTEKKTSQKVKHAGAIQQVHLVATTDLEASSEGMLLITCSKEVNDERDQTIGIWRIDSEVWSNVCRLHPMVVPDYIAGMVKYVDPSHTANFILTYANPNVTSLTANDLLRIRGQYQSLFEKLVKSLLLKPAQESIADRSQSRALDPDTSFKRERTDDPNFEDGDCYYWIQSSDSIDGHGPTFVMDQRLAIEDCKVGMVIREKDTPSDKIGGLFEIVSIEGVEGSEHKVGFIEKLFSPEKMLKSMVDVLSKDSDHPTITVSKLDDETGRPDMTTLNERGRHPSEFTQAAFWEGYNPTPGPDWLLFFATWMPYDWSIWMSERGIGIVQLISFVVSWPAQLWSYRKKLKLGMLGGDEENDFDDTEEDADWNRLFESAKSGQPVEAMVVPLPGAAAAYGGAQKSWDNLLKFEAEENHEDLSLLHVCVSYCDEHPEENNSLLGLEIPETIVQFKWYKYGQKRTMEDFRFYLWLVVTFSGFTYRRIEYGFEMGQSVFDHVLAALVVGLTFRFMWGEVTAIRVAGWVEYLPDFWNWMDWSCYITMLSAVIQSWKLPNFEASWEQKQLVSPTWDVQPPVLFAVPQLLLWAKVLYFLRAFEETGVFTMMIVRICYNVRYFIVIMAIMILGFTFTFYIMFNESDRLYVSERSGAYENIFMSIISTYNMGVLGDFNMDAFFHQEQEVVMLTLFFLLTAIVQIVLLNLLIALMGSIYEKEEAHSANHRRAERASMILEIEAKMNVEDRLSEEFFPQHLHVLREKLDGSRRQTPAKGAAGLHMPKAPAVQQKTQKQSALPSAVTGASSQKDTLSLNDSAGNAGGGGSVEAMSEQMRQVEEKVAGLDDKMDRLFALLEGGGGGGIGASS